MKFTKAEVNVPEKSMMSLKPQAGHGSLLSHPAGLLRVSKTTHTRTEDVNVAERPAEVLKGNAKCLTGTAI